MVAPITIGPRVQALRRERGLEVRELAQQAGLSRAFVNQIEAGTASPSLKSLQSLATALDVTVPVLLEDEPDGASEAAALRPSTDRVGRSGPQRPAIVRRDQRKALTYPGAQGTVELITPDLHRMLEVLLDSDAPGQDLPPTHVHDGDTVLFILAGTYEGWIDGERFVLDEGDSIYFANSLPHAVRLIGDRPGQAIWFSSPPFF